MGIGSEECSQSRLGWYLLERLGLVSLTGMVLRFDVPSAFKFVRHTEVLTL